MKAGRRIAGAIREAQSRFRQEARGGFGLTLVERILPSLGAAQLNAFKAVSRLRYTIDHRLEALANNLLAASFRSTSASGGDYRVVRQFESDDKPRWSVAAQPGDTDGWLTIIIVTYKQPEALNCLLSSLRLQTLQNFNVVVMHDGPDEATRAVVDDHMTVAPSRCRYVESQRRFNDYGHSLRDIGISEADAEYVLLTNGDNYYSPRLIEYAHEAVWKNALDLVAWNMVHSHSHPGNTRNTSYSPFNVFPLPYRIDVGAFLARTSLARQHGFRDKTHDGDATYLLDIIESAAGSLRIGKIEKTLMMHN